MNYRKILSKMMLFAVTAFASSCVNIDNELGVNLVAIDQYLEVKTVDIDLPVELAVCDSLQTGSPEKLMFGSVNHGKFGTFDASMALAIVPAIDSIDWGKDPEFQEMTLLLPLSVAFYTSDDQRYIPQNIHVHQLKKAMDSTCVFTSSITEKDIDFDTKITLNDPVYKGGLSESVSVSFTKEFASKLFKFSMEQLDSTEYFLNHFYGLHISVDSEEENSEGGRLNYFDPTETALFFTYKTTDDEGKRVYRTATFDLSYASCGVYKSSSKSLETKDAKEAIYCEGLTGIKPVIRAEKLHDAVTDWAQKNNVELESAIINRALIRLPFEYDGNLHSLDKYPAALSPCKRIFDKSVAEYPYFAPAEEVDDSMFLSGEINRSFMEYRIDIGIQMQSIMDKEKGQFTQYDDLWLMPSTTITSSYTATSYSIADNTVYYYGVLNGTESSRKPQISITYTTRRKK